MINVITSISNSQVKHWVKLSKSSSLRHQSKTCLIEGQTMVSEAINYGLIEMVLLKEETKFNIANDTHVQRLSEHCFKKISQLNNVDVMAIAKLPKWDIDISNCERILICDKLQNPDNLGTLIRSAHAAEFDALITTPGSADIFNPKCLRASTGSALRFASLQLKVDNLIDLLKQNDFKIIALAADGDYQLFNNCPTGKIALVVGNEGQGISDAIRDNVTHTASLPQNPAVESLNASIAASIAMYQIRWASK